jgi:hypothetical protein
VIEGYATQINVIISLFTGGENDFSVYYSLIYDLFSEKFV